MLLRVQHTTIARLVDRSRSFALDGSFSETVRANGEEPPTAMPTIQTRARERTTPKRLIQSFCPSIAANACFQCSLSYAQSKAGDERNGIWNFAGHFQRNQHAGDSLEVGKMVGATGFEPATSWSQTKCSTRLSYAPLQGALPSTSLRRNARTEDHTTGFHTFVHYQ